MPGFNQTGPMGQGPMTGCRMGRCTNYGNAGKQTDNTENTNIQQNQELNNEPPFGMGRGMRRGRGEMGRGRRRGFRGGF